MELLRKRADNDWVQVQSVEILDMNSAIDNINKTRSLVLNQNGQSVLAPVVLENNVIYSPLQSKIATVSSEIQIWSGVG